MSDLFFQIGLIKDDTLIDLPPTGFAGGIRPFLSGIYMPFFKHSGFTDIIQTTLSFIGSSIRFVRVKLSAHRMVVYHSVSLLLCFLGLGLNSCIQSPGTSQKKISFARLQADFIQPPPDDYPVTRWIWNDHLTQDEIAFQLNEFRDRGITGVLIVPEQGMRPDVASKDWRDLFLYTKAKAESLGVRSGLEIRGLSPDVREGAIENGWHNAFRNISCIEPSKRTGQLSRAIGAAVRSGHDKIYGEFFTNTDFGLSFGAMKSEVDQAFALGFNSVCFGQSYYTLSGAERTRGPSFSYHASWWELFPYMTRYFARLSTVLSSARPVRHVLVLRLASSEENAESFPSDPEDLTALLNGLRSGCIEFDVCDETDFLRNASVKKQILMMGEQAYSVLIVVWEGNAADNKTWRKILKFSRNGGDVTCFRGARNRSVPSGPSGIEKFFARGNTIDLPLSPEFLNIISSPRFHIALNDSASGKLLHIRRKTEDGQLLFLVNTSSTEPVRGDVRLAGDAVYRLDAFHGLTERYPSVAEHHDQKFGFSLSPLESLLLFCASCDTFGIRNSRFVSAGEGTVLDSPEPPVIESTYFNSAVLNRCTVLNETDTLRGLSIQEASDYCRNKSCQVQYPFHLQAGVDRSALMAAVRVPAEGSVTVNGRPVQPMRDAWLVDRSFSVYEIGSFSGAGEDVLALFSGSEDRGLSPVYLFGDFSLRIRKNRMILEAGRQPVFGSWKDQGMPAYADGMSYSRPYQIRKSGARYWVKLNAWYGSVAEVYINDFPAGMIGWPPYTLHVTEYVQEGLNYVEVIVYGFLNHIILSREPGERINDCPADEPESCGLFEGFMLIRQEADTLQSQRPSSLSESHRL